MSAPGIEPEAPTPNASTLVALQRLIEVVAQLRSPEGGCPWDLAQTPDSLIPYVLEEAYEVADAIRQGDRAAIVDELGDLLLQVVLQAQIASEQNHFTLEEVAEAIVAKLIRRHPHVFGDVVVNSVAEVKRNWETIKTTEQAGTNPSEQGDEAAPPRRLSERLSRYARTLPPLMGAMKIAQKAAIQGFEWEDVSGVWAKFHEELAELEEAVAHSDKTHQQEELGDVLFSLVNIARWYELDPAIALQETNHKFLRRMSLMEEVADRPLDDYTLAELDELWNQAKRRLRQGKNNPPPKS